MREEMHRPVAAGLLAILALAAVVTITGGHDSQAIIREEGVPRHAFSADELVPEADDVLAETEAWYSDSHSPADVEAAALRAVTHAKKAAIALQTTRQAVVRLQELGDTAGAASALQAEHQAKRAFLAARATSAPLVAEARANYEATEGTQIQGLAKQVAHDTWRTMTGTPLPPAVGGGLRGASGSRRQALVRSSSATVARDYAAEATRAQVAAIGAQRAQDKAALQPKTFQKAAIAAGAGNPAVAAIAKFAKQAQDAMEATNAAKEVVQQQLKEIKKERAALATANATHAKAALNAGDQGGPDDVIANAESDVSNAMGVVQAAANKRGMVDHSWKDRIGDMLKNGQTAQADEAASKYVQQKVDSAATKVADSSALDAASKDIDGAAASVAATAKRHGTEELAIRW